MIDSTSRWEGYDCTVIYLYSDTPRRSKEAKLAEYIALSKELMSAFLHALPSRLEELGPKALLSKPKECLHSEVNNPLLCYTHVV